MTDFAKHQILVVDGLSGNKIIYHTSPEHADKIYLYKNGSHFDLITNIKAFRGVNYYCDFCEVGYIRVDGHKCPRKCGICFQYSCNDSKEAEMSCRRCHETFPNQTCFDNHKMHLCKTRWKCPLCTRSYARKDYPVDIDITNAHTCGDCLCNNCRQMVSGDHHQCFMQ
jgi:hypothetical protein